MIRCDYVSNSSSSSFIIPTNDVSTKDEELENKQHSIDDVYENWDDCRDWEHDWNY